MANSKPTTLVDSSDRKRGALAGELHSIAIHLLRRARRDDRSFGVSAARLSALSVLVYGGDQRLGALADAEQVRPPTMTRMVQAMERDGLVEVRTPAGDRRARVITATPAGRRVLEKARDARVANLGELLEPLDHEALEQLEDAVAKVRSILA